MKLKQVTLTGADDSIESAKLFDITEKYPFVEWAILLSKKQMGGKRFPSAAWMRKLNGEIKVYSEQIDFAGHLCGSWLDNLMLVGDISFIHDIPMWSHFKRIQLNFHAEPRVLSEQAIEAMRTLCWDQGKQFVVQMDGVNNHIYEELLNAGIIAWGLYDTSHGAGVLPEEWPEEIPSIGKHIYRGYAGGLGEDCLEAELIKLEQAVEGDVVWVDMETKLRSAFDVQFDLDKCTGCLELCKKYTA